MRRAASNLLLLVEKDLRLEFRSRETLISAMLFAVVTLMLFSFSFQGSAATQPEAAAGILWIVIAFAGTMAVSHLSGRDAAEGTREGLLLSGCGAGTMFAARFVTMVVFLALIEALTLTVFMVFFHFRAGSWLVTLLPVLGLGTFGFAAVGTIVGEMLGHSRLKGLLLPVVFFPLVVPLLLAASAATAACMSGELPSLWLLIGFDLVFVTGCALFYEFALEDPT